MAEQWEGLGGAPGPAPAQRRMCFFLGDMAASWSLRGLSTPGGAFSQGFLQRGRIHGNASYINHVLCNSGRYGDWELPLGFLCQMALLGPNAGTIHGT